MNTGNIDNFVFLDASNASGESSIYYLPNGSGSFVLSVIPDAGASVDISVMCKTDYQLDEWFPISVINKSDFSKVDTIDAAGIYVAPMDGIAQCKVVNNGVAGSVKVFGILRDTMTTVLASGEIHVTAIELHKTAGEVTGGLATMSDGSTFDITAKDASLSELNIQHLTLNPEFDPKTEQYTASTSATSSNISFVPYDDDSTVIVKLNGTEIEDTAAWQIGENALSFDVKNGSAEMVYDVSVTRYRVLESIEITTPPDKTEYTSLETFDPTGMIVTATYNTGEAEDVHAPDSRLSYEPDTVDSGTDHITVAMSDGHNTVYANQPVTVL